MPTHAYIALSTTTPDSTGGNVTEPVGNNYSRKQTVGSDWAAASDGVIANANVIVFDTPTGNWNQITHFMIYDADTAGNPLVGGLLNPSKTVYSGDPVDFTIGQLSLTMVTVNV